MIAVRIPQRRNKWSVGALALVLLAAGCSSRKGTDADVNEVAGVVWYDGKKLSYGKVKFIGKDGETKASVIFTDGTYSIRNPPLGPVKIVVDNKDTPPPVSGGGGPDGPPKIEIIAIPERYMDPEKTDLTYTVEKGQHRYDIRLKP